MFEQGRSKTGGRRPGTPNKTAANLKEQIAAFVGANFEQFTTDLSQLEPKERATLYLKMMEYVLPKQREQLNVEQTGTQLVRRDEEDGSIIIEFLRADEDPAEAA
jgi:uncharacterized protein YbcI